VRDRLRRGREVLVASTARTFASRSGRDVTCVMELQRVNDVNSPPRSAADGFAGG